VTTNVPSYDPNTVNSEMTITFPDEACSVTYTWKAYLLMKRQFKNKTRKAFSTTLLPFYVVLLDVVKNDIIIA